MNIEKLGLVALIANGLAIVSAILSSAKMITDNLPLPSWAAWILMLAVILNVLVWKLSTQMREAGISGAHPGPIFGIIWPIITALIGAITILTVGVLVGNAKYPSVSLPKFDLSAKTAVKLETSSINNFEDLYLAYNKEIIDGIQESEKGKIFFVIGAAGSGKSFIRKALEKKYSNAKVIRLCIKESSSNICKQPEGIYYSNKPELTFGINADQIINTMSSIDKIDGNVLLGNANNNSLLLIDDLDEIHPKSWGILLRILPKYAESNNKVVVFGRPEAFYPYFKDRELPSEAKDVIVFELNPPEYTSQWEFALHAKNWAKFSKNKINDSEAEKIAVSVFKYTKDHPWLTDSYKNLELANYICERFHEKLSWTEDDLKGLIVNRLFERAAETHGRPQFSNVEYQALFADIARESAAVINKDGKMAGYFSATNKYVSVYKNKLKTGDIRYGDVLSLSGIAYLSPINWQEQYWRFVPNWTHEFLLDKYNASIKPNYWVWYVIGWGVLTFSPIVTLLFSLIARGRLCVKHA